MEWVINENQIKSLKIGTQYGDEKFKEEIQNDLEISM